MTISKPILYLSGPEDDHDFWEPWMKFRLTYSGPLRSINRDAKPDNPDYMALHKHEIRQKFHVQLKQLWKTNKFLANHKVSKSFSPHYGPLDGASYWGGPDEDDMKTMHDVMATWYSNNGFNFLPLVSEKFGLLCSLDILFLRHDIPGSAISAGDIDNRIKTLIDALRLPRLENEFVGKDMQKIQPQDGEDPFYCLLEDDKQVSHFSVETDTLLEPKGDNNADINRVSLVITVTLRPYDITMFNLNFS